MEKIIKEAVLLIPHLVFVHAESVHGVGNPYEMLDEAVSNLFIHRVVLSENERDLQHVLAVEGHPCRAIGLVKVSAGKHVLPGWIFAVDPPVVILHQPLEGTLQEAQVSAT